MAIVNGYCTLPELKDHLHGVADNIDDVLLDGKINAASRAIDGVCNRRFYQDGSGSARLFAASVRGRVSIDDCGTITEVATDAGSGDFATVWTSTDYQEEPLNGKRDGLEGWPVMSLRATGNHCFPVSAEALVRVTATWGWAAVPVQVSEACLIVAAKLYKRRDTAEGFVAFEGAGVRNVVESDRDAMAVRSPFLPVL